jgi:hypothetical protein
MLNVYDVEFKFIAYHCPIPSLCKMFVFDGDVCLIDSDGIMHRVAENPLNEKLDGLIKSSLFDVAIG